MWNDLSKIYKNGETSYDTNDPTRNNKVRDKILDAIDKGILPKDDTDFRVKLIDIVVNHKKYKTFTEAAPAITCEIDKLLKKYLKQYPHILTELGLS